MNSVLIFKVRNNSEFIFFFFVGRRGTRSHHYNWAISEMVSSVEFLLVTDHSKKMVPKVE